MTRRRVAALVLIGSVAASACGSSEGRHATSPLSTMPDRVSVDCSPLGITVSAVTVAAQRSGVVLVVSSTMSPGTYLTYGSDGVGSFAGGDPLPRQPTAWTLPLAPGTVTLGCGLDATDDPGHRATVRVTDPGGFWRGESLAEAGCRSRGGQPSWVAGLRGTGATARQAVRQTLDAFEAFATSQHRAATYTARPAGIGYAGATTQTWVAAENGRPELTIDVTGEDDRYTAYPDRLCHD